MHCRQILYQLSYEECPSGLLITNLEVGEREAEWEAQTSSQSEQTQELLGVTGNAQGSPEALGYSQGLGGPFPLLGGV